MINTDQAWRIGELDLAILNMRAGNMDQVRRTSNPRQDVYLRLPRRFLQPLWKIFLVGVCLLAAVAQAQSATEYQVKAAFLFNFARFVEWPADAFPSADSALQICVLGQDPFGRDFEQVIVDKMVNGHRIEVAHPDGVPQARACQILFIAASEKAHLPSILQGLKGTSVLIVGDTPGFASAGGTINFVLDDGRVRFEINLKAAEFAHLKISARLLTVAKVVLNGEAGGNQ